MEKFGNDTFKYNGKLYKVVKKETGHRCSDTCPLYNYGRCGNICSVMYNQLKNPEFTYEDVVLVEVAPGEADIKNDEIDYKALYEETISRLKIAKKNVGYYTFSEVIDKVIPEVAESEDERIKRAILEFFESQDENTSYSFVHRNDIIAWLKKQKESKRIEQEQTELPKGEDYAIDGLWQAIQILEHSLGEVDGWQSDDGILEHKCAIEAVKRLYEHKSAWSEEDEKMFNSIIEDVMPCGECPDYPTNEEREYFYEGNRKVDWLKCLKDRMIWKPTEEQMEALGDAVKLYKSTHFDSHHYKIETLYNDLKKL